MSSKVRLNHLTDMRQTVLDFVEDLRENVFPTSEYENDFTRMRMYVMALSDDALMQKVIKNFLPHSNYAENRNPKFFKAIVPLLSRLPKTRVSFYLSKLKSGELGEDNMNTIWGFMNTIIAIAEDFKKTK